MNMSQINIGDYPISCSGQNKAIWGYGYIKEINECLWDGIIKLEWNFEITLRKFWIQLRTSNSPDFIILDLIMRIYFTYIT